MDGPWPWSRAMILALICSGCTAEIPALLKAASWQQLPLKTKFIGNSFSIMSVCCVRLAKTTIFAVFRVQTRCVEEVFTTRWRHICHQVPSKWKAIPKQRNEKGRCVSGLILHPSSEKTSTVPLTNQMLETDRLGQSRNKAYLCTGGP